MLLSTLNAWITKVPRINCFEGLSDGPLVGVTAFRSFVNPANDRRVMLFSSGFFFFNADAQYQEVAFFLFFFLYHFTVQFIVFEIWGPTGIFGSVVTATIRPYICQGKIHLFFPFSSRQTRLLALASLLAIRVIAGRSRVIRFSVL